MKWLVVLLLSATFLAAQTRRVAGPTEGVVPTAELRMTALADAPGFPASERYRTRATALVEWQGAMYGVAAGQPTYLFSVEPGGSVKLISEIPVAGVGRGILTTDGAGTLCTGTSPSITGDGIVQSYVHPEAVDPFRNAPAGHILCTEGRAQTWKDLGTVADHEGIYALISDPQAKALYGVTFPSGIFFRVDLGSGKMESHGRLFERTLIGTDEHFRPVPRALAVGGDGRVWTSGDKGFLYVFDPRTRKLEATKVRLPGVPGRQSFNVVDALLSCPEGKLYGGTSDGYLFRFDPATGRVTNFGKPVEDSRIRAMVFGEGETLYGVAGSSKGICRLFSFSPHGGELNIFGIVERHDPPNYDWMIYQIDALALDSQGRIYVAESESPSHIAVLKLKP